MESEGWLFDLHQGHSTVVLWIYDRRGTLLRLEDRFHPAIYAGGAERDLRALARTALARGFCSSYRFTERREFWSGERVRVLELLVQDYERLPALLRKLPELEDRVRFYNCDIPIPQYYLYCKDLFPLCRCAVEHVDGRVVAIRSLEDQWEREYAAPPLRVVELGVARSHLLPLSRRNTLCVRTDAGERAIEARDARALIAQWNALITQEDPDVLLSAHGDSCIIPSLLTLARRERMPLVLDREPERAERAIVTKGRSYFSYGKIAYNAPAYPLFGRWHIDRHNSFIFRETGFPGLLELARMSRIPVQRLARTSTGTAITSMQLHVAVREGILVPWRKGEPERFKTAWDLLVCDKGGLVYQPRVGLYEGVAEIDFASMYPAIMVTHNISPETVLCGCCHNAAVPEIGYNVCERREGLVPRTLRPVLERRAYYKRRRRETAGEEAAVYDRRQSALKWMLVTCFGYLGYKNARFGRIEAHEAVTAFGREKLLQAKEICEAKGWELLHAITDCLWLVKPGMRDEELEALCAEVSRATDIPMSVEGVYRWFVVLPSKVKPDFPVANRYFGVFRDGTLKARGIAFRRDDTPPFVRDAQLLMLAALAEADGVEAYRARVAEVFALLRDAVRRLRAGRVEREALVVTKTLSRPPDEYAVDNLNALAAGQLLERGIRLYPGEKVSYIIRNAAGPKRDRVRAVPFLRPDERYDAEEYIALLLDAAAELLVPVGYTRETLRRNISSPQLPLTA